MSIKPYPAILTTDTVVRQHDFSDWMQAGDTIFSNSIVITISPNGTDNDLVLVSPGELDGSGQAVNCRISGGTAGTTYQIDCLINTVVTAESVTRSFSQKVVAGPL